MMICQNCSDRGTVARDLGAGIYSFGPCPECDIHLLNKRRVEQERRDLLARKSRDNPAPESDIHHRHIHRRKSRLPDWNLRPSERL